MIASVETGDLYHPTFAGNMGGRFAVASSFVYTYAGLVNALIPAAGFDQLVWTTPSAPFMLEWAFIQLMGACTASQNPGTPALKLTLAGADLVGGAMTAWSGPTYAIDGANQIMWGLKTDRITGGLFSTFAGNGDGAHGAMAGYGAVAALAGGSAGFWDKPVSLHVDHGGGNVTMKIPFRVQLLGRLL